ncbi:MAG: bifunctional ADP-heptose synthase [Crocinitomicaceae bacterium]|nr:bifunctional ADP-heptose synthase [Crocinitomicaceae bacterium]
MNLENLFEKFNQLKVAVVGDVMIDAYLLGKVNRVSPEAPVPVVNLIKHEERLGGAANVALNLVALGAKPIMCSCVGNDKEGLLLHKLLIDAGISDKGIITSETRMTTVKTRVLGNSQHLLRIDAEQTSAISSEEEVKLIQKVKEIIEEGIDVLIFEDYNKGVLTNRVIQELITIANNKGVITTVDPKKDNFLAYKNVSLFKPNLKELVEGTGVSVSFKDKPEQLEEAIKLLETTLNHKISFVTLSEFGVFIKDNKEKYHIPAHIRNIADVSGAGDTVISVASLCLAAGASLKEIAAIANIAGGLVCEYSGVVSIDKNKLLSETKKLLNK